MAPIRWTTLVACEETGVIEYKRVREFIAATAAMLGIALALFATAWELFTGHPIGDRTLLGWLVTALILPVTGGTVAGGITATVMKKNGYSTGTTPK